MIKRRKQSTVNTKIDYPKKDGTVEIISVEARTKREFLLKREGIVLALKSVLGLEDADVQLTPFDAKYHKWFQ